MNMRKQHSITISFLVCAGVLLAAAGTKTLVIKKLGIYRVKEAIYLQHPFDELQEEALLPFVAKNKSKIQNREVLESLGTDEYLQWHLEDTEAAPNSPTRYCSLFLTYYTGTPDMVPHVPDECYAGGGNRPLGKETLSLEIPVNVGAAGGADAVRDQDVDFQYIRFAQSTDSMMQGEVKFSVQYFFHANGEYCKDRTETRVLLGGNWFSPYSYFCKVEWKFFNLDSYNRYVYPTKDQTLEASEKLLTVLLPELEKNHWPDWEAANRKHAAAKADDETAGTVTGDKR